MYALHEGKILPIDRETARNVWVKPKGEEPVKIAKGWRVADRTSVRRARNTIMHKMRKVIKEKDEEVDDLMREMQMLEKARRQDQDRGTC